MTNKWRLPLASLLRIVNAASDEETRYYLRGVFVTKPDNEGRVWLVATDGSVMAIKKLPEDENIVSAGALIIHKDAIAQMSHMAKQFVKVTKRNAYLMDRIFVEFWADKDESTFPWSVRILQLRDAGADELISYSWPNLAIDGTFPDWCRVIPSDADMKESSMIGVTPKLLVQLSTTTQESFGLMLRFSSPRDGDKASTGPAVVTSAEQDWWGLIMPRVWKPDVNPVVPITVPQFDK